MSLSKDHFHLASHRSFKPSSRLHSNFHSLSFHITFTFHTAAQPHHPLIFFLFLHIFFLSIKPWCSTFVLSHSPSPLRGTSIDRGTAVVLTGVIWLLFYLEQRLMLHHTFKNLQFGGFTVASPLNENKAVYGSL